MPHLRERVQRALDQVLEEGAYKAATRKVKTPNGLVDFADSASREAFIGSRLKELLKDKREVSFMNHGSQSTIFIGKRTQIHISTPGVLKEQLSLGQVG